MDWCGGLRMLAVTSLGLGLVGCVSSGASNQVVARGETRIASSSPLLSQAGEMTITAADPWSREDYTLFQSPGVQAEFLYATASPGSGTGLNRTPDFGGALQSWNINQGARQMGQLWRRERAGRTITYQPYRLDGPGWGCVALQSAWGGGATPGRPSDLVFGYVCNKKAKVLSRTQALRIIDSLSFLDTPRGTPASRRLTLAGGADLTAAVQGATGDGQTGLGDFPFGFGQPVRDNRVGYSGGIGVGSSVGVYGTYGTRIGYGGYGGYPYGAYPYGGYDGYRGYGRGHNRGHDRGDHGRGGRGDGGRGNLGGDSSGGSNSGADTGGGGSSAGGSVGGSGGAGDPSGSSAGTSYGRFDNPSGGDSSRYGGRVGNPDITSH